MLEMCFFISAEVIGSPAGRDVQSGLTDRIICLNRVGVSRVWYLVQFAGPSLLSKIFCGLLHMHVGLILISQANLESITMRLNAYF
jgi:hypothetical protein